MTDVEESPTTPDTPQIGKWIDLLRYSFADIFVRGEWDDFGLFRFLNRFAFISRQQLIFVVGHRDGSKLTSPRQISSYDPVYFDLLIEFLVEGGVVTRHPVIQTDRTYQLNRKSTKFLFDIFDSGLCMLIFQARTVHDAKKPASQPKIAFEPVSPDSGLGQICQQLFARFEGQYGLGRRKSDISVIFDQLSTPEVYEEALDIPPEQQVLGAHASGISLEDGDQKDTDFFNGTILTIVDSEYRRLMKSESLVGFQPPASDGSAVANAFFFTKSFSARRTRYDTYMFDTRLCLSGAVRKVLGNGLRALQRQDMIPYPDRKADDAFWAMFDGRSAAERDDDIIAILNEPPSLHVRLFTDNALMSGAIGIVPNIFAHGDVGWIHQHCPAADRPKALRHLICLHYALQLGSPVVPAEARELSAVVLPFRCSGGIWMCAVFLRENHSADDDHPAYGGLVSQSTFEASFATYHSLLRESERRIRRKAKYTYLRELTRLAGELVEDSRRAPDLARGELAFTRDGVGTFNRKSVNLSRAFPFPLIQIDFDKLREPKLQEVPIEEGANPFFDRLTLRPFLDKDEIKSEINKTIYLGARLS